MTNNKITTLDINMQAVIVHRMIKDGMYIYERGTKK